MFSESPRSLTILPTYKCTAECSQCCFESSPRLKGRLSLSTITTRIDQAVEAFPLLRHVTFSGGEALLLKDDLMRAIAHCRMHRLSTRLVSNGFWGARKETAKRMVDRLEAAGLQELNLSTGIDHIQYVPLRSVISAAKASVERGIRTLVTIEADICHMGVSSEVLRDEWAGSAIARGVLSVISNSWVNFKPGSEERNNKELDAERPNGCAQLFDTVTVTPADQLAACCGLTMEHIPEMKIGSLQDSDILSLYKLQFDDFMKMWISVDGPARIIQRITAGTPLKTDLKFSHPCEACAFLHLNPAVAGLVREGYEGFVSEIVDRFAMGRELMRVSHRKE